MAAERFRAIESLFHEALACPPDEREALLATRCAGDDELRREVESLLARARSADRFLTTLRVPDPRAAEALPVGRRLGPYEIASLIATGGMGVVYQARDTRLGRDVAFKVLPADLADGVARFEREARATAALNHPHVAAIFDVGTIDGITFIVSELVKGPTLRTLMAPGPLPIARVVDIGAQLADGLAAAHGAGIVHRDLKPENVVFSDTGMAKIVDFGIAKAMGPQADWSGEALTKTGVILGTIDYMAPEQARRESVDARTDIFALGAVLYELTSGRPPFRRDSLMDTVDAILTAAPPPLSSRSGEPIPRAVEEIIERCLHKPPSARFQSAGDLGFALRNALREPEIGHPPAITGTDVRAGRAPRWQTLAWMAGLLAAALLGVIVDRACWRG